MSARASGARMPDLFDRARRKVSVEDLLKRESIKLVRSGSQLRGACPLCDGGGQRFAVNPDKAGDKWRCYGCDLHGDVVDLAAALYRLSPRDTLQRLLGEDLPTSDARERPDAKARADKPKTADMVAQEILAEAQPFAGSLAERYLLKRGISAEVLELAGPGLRYHARAKHHWSERQRTWVRAPAMVAQVVTAAGPTGGAHVTYLDRATAAKARLVDDAGAPMPAKRMWGPQTDAEGRPGAAWLIGPDGDGDLVVSEGIETGLSLATLARLDGRRVRAAAALALGRLQGGWKRDDEGCVDLAQLEPEPSAPAFTWPPPEAAPWGEVLIAVDRDMSPLRVRARTGRGKVCWHLLDGETRARICGRLAVAAWRAAGAPRCRAIVPGPGRDFNDELRARLAQGGVA